MRIKSLSAACLLALWVPTQILQAGELPDLGLSAQSTFTQKQEQALGDRIIADIRSQHEMLDDVALVDYLNRLGNRLASASSNPTQQFTFFIVEDPSINAFALPGGYIGIHTGLILTAQSESELAAVLAHEIGHVVQKHMSRGIAQSENNQWATIALFALGLLAARSNTQVAEALVTSSQALSIQHQLNYTRAHESEADRVGFDILVKAGFDPRAMPMFFQRMARAHRLMDSGGSPYLRTHPLDAVRLTEAQDQAEKQPYKQFVDSAEYGLLREKVRALTDAPAAQITYFKAALAEKRYNNEAATHFGLATALRKAHQEEAAMREAKLAFAQQPHPLTANLLAELLLDNAQTEAAIAVITPLLQSHPGNVSLNDTLIQCRLKQNQTLAAISLSLAQIHRDEDAPRFYERLAQAYAQAGKTGPSRQAQAEAYYRQHRLSEAITQMHLALGATDNDFYQSSIQEARLKSWAEEETLQKTLLTRSQ